MVFNLVWISISYSFELLLDLLKEITKREEEAGIQPDADADLFMKVALEKFLAIFLIGGA